MKKRFEAELLVLGDQGIKWEGDESVRYLRLQPWDALDEETRNFAPPAENGEPDTINIITDSQNFLWSLAKRHPKDQYQLAAAFWSICQDECGFAVFDIDSKKYLISGCIEDMEEGTVTLHVS